MSRTILVTGGAGFIGSHLSETLLNRGDRVVVFDNFNDYYSPARKQQNVQECLKQDNFKLVTGDVRDTDAVQSLFTTYPFDCVVHLAAMAGVRPSIEKPALYADVNVTGTINVLEAMKQAGVAQIIFASSSSVYGNRHTGPFSETDNTDKQISPYGATKKAGELICATYAHLYGIKTTCLRFFTVYGPKNRPDMANFLFMNALLTSQPITQYGDGTTGRDYTFVSDTVNGIIAAIDTPFHYEIINLGNSSPVLLKKLIATMEEVTGKTASLKVKPMQQGDVELTYADITKAKRLLGWEPQTRLPSGLAQLYAWFNAHEQHDP